MIDVYQYTLMNQLFRLMKKLMLAVNFFIDASVNKAGTVSRVFFIVKIHAI